MRNDYIGLELPEIQYEPSKVFRTICPISHDMPPYTVLNVLHNEMELAIIIVGPALSGSVFAIEIR